MFSILGKVSQLVKEQFPGGGIYAQGVKNDRPNPRDTLAHNLVALMKLHDISQNQLAKMSGVDQKTICNIVNTKNAPKLDKVDAIAAAFGLQAWHLIIPNLPEELMNGGTIERLMRNFLAADRNGREYINHVAEREAEYKIR